jgi:3',5'-cyclic AMP phosphodiesterase CpdA
VLPDERMQTISSSGELVFHLVGDTGGVKSPESQQIVAMNMDRDFEVPDPVGHPAFFYHLGDVVYYYGAASEYYPQFYEPYVHYPAPIFAIPGNHDGDLPPQPGDSQSQLSQPSTQEPTQQVQSLDAFVRNFCSDTPQITPEAKDVPRDAMTQPNVYWTLEAPFITIVGLYTNVPEGGEVSDEQREWLHSELQGAAQDKALVVTMHHPIYSADGHHSGSEYMGQVLDEAIEQTSRIPDAVFAGHVHNYQRFTRRRNDGREVPYIVAGAGGYWHLHYVEKHLGRKVQTPFTAGDPSVTLESYCDDRHGYLRLEVGTQILRGRYFAVPRPQEPWSHPAQQVDTFTLDLSQHRLIR